jgi:hypothetical protein
VPYFPYNRDTAWQNLYQAHRGQIDEQFGFLAFRTAPLVSASTMDGKVATADMAQNMMVWAAIGKPNQREWVAGAGRHGYAKNDGLFPSGYRLFRAEASDGLRAAVQANETARTASPAQEGKSKTDRHAHPAAYDERDLWKGWVLPASDADVWLASGAASYYHDLTTDDLDLRMDVRRAAYRRLEAASGAEEAHALETVKGELFLDGLRKKMGDDAFLKLMRDYFTANTTKTVAAQSFLDGAKATFSVDAGKGAIYQTTDIRGRLQSAMLVYGTVREAGANRYAAEQLQKRFLDDYESAVPVRKDFEVTDEELLHRDIIFVGRPEANSALAAWREQLGLDYHENVFRLDGAAYGSERDALLYAGRNPLDAKHMVLVLAGNDALRTVKLAEAVSEWKTGEYDVVEDGRGSAGFLKAR